MDTHAETKLTKRQRFWFDHIKTCDASGKSLASYAKENSLNVQTMYTTKASLITKGRLNRPSRPTFQRAQISSGETQHNWRIQLSNGISVMFSDGADTNQLSSILQVTTKV